MSATDAQDWHSHPCTNTNETYSVW